MADLGDAVFSRLSTNAAVYALVGKRIKPGTPVRRPPRPYITYSVISMLPRAHAMGADPSLVTDRLQVDLWADKHKDRIALNNAVMSMLSRWRGTEAGVTIKASFHIDRRDNYEPGTKLYRRSLDFEISWLES